MATFVDMVRYLDAIGLASVLLPFLLVFTIVFAILEQSKILGETEQGKPQKRLNLVVALSFGFAVVVPHVLGTYPPGYDAVIIINSLLPQVSILIVAVLMLMLLMGAFGGQWNIESGFSGSWVIIFSIIAIGYIFGTTVGWFGGGRYPWFLGWLADPGTQSLITTLLVFGIVLWFITREDKDKDLDRRDKMKEKYWGWKSFGEE